MTLLIVSSCTLLDAKRRKIFDDCGPDSSLVVQLGIRLYEIESTSGLFLRIGEVDRGTRVLVCACCHMAVSPPEPCLQTL